MFKFILIVVVGLALIGGAVDFVSTEESWSLIVNKQTALSSVQNGAFAVYELTRDLVQNLQNEASAP
jgi:hypothetical protein